MPDLSVTGHSSQGSALDRLDDGVRADRDAADVAKEMREKEIKPTEVVQAKPQIELQPRVIETQQVQSTQKMSSAEIAEIVRKVESMVSRVRLQTTAAGDKQMAMTISDGRLKGVEIKVTVDKSGKVNAEFKADAAEARSALTENIKELEKSLQSKGLEVNKLEIGSDATGRRDFSSQQEQRDRHEAAQTQLDSLEGGGNGPAQHLRDPRMGGGGAHPAGPRTGVGVPGAVPAGGAAVPSGNGPESSNYVA